MSGRDTIARAFVLARTGPATTVTEIRRILTKEGCVAVHENLSGRGMQKQLRDAISARVAAKNA